MQYSTLMLALSLATIVSFKALTTEVAAAPERDCFWHLEQSRGNEITCEFPTRLTEQEKSELRRLTRELLQDAHCVVSIRIERHLVDAALTSPEHVFQAPEQPVRCEIKTRDSVIPITASFAPRVVFSGGQAIEATPGLANVVGVSSVLAWPAVQYVNRSATIRDGMLTVINGYRTHKAAKRAELRMH